MSIVGLSCNLALSFIGYLRMLQISSATCVLGRLSSRPILIIAYVLYFGFALWHLRAGYAKVSRALAWNQDVVSGGDAGALVGHDVLLF